MSILLKDLVGIINDSVTIEIDCEAINDYIAKIHGHSTKILFSDAYLTENKVKDFYDNEVWSIHNGTINIKNKDKTIYYKDQNAEKDVIQKKKVRNSFKPRNPYDYL